MMLKFLIVLLVLFGSFGAFDHGHDEGIGKASMIGLGIWFFSMLIAAFLLVFV